MASPAACAGVRERQSVPIILANAARFEDEFLKVYPLVAKHVADKYRQAGVIVAGTWRFLVFVEADRQPTRMDPHLRLPCFQ